MWRKTDSRIDYIKPHILTVALKRVKQTAKKHPDVFGKEKLAFSQIICPKFEIVDCRTTAEKKAKGI